jgi:hypothetical protein
MARWTPTLASSALVALIALAPAPCAAQDRASAEELFQLGKAAMAKNELLKACGYFQGSLKADFALGTLLNLAICHEQAGRVASAWGEFRTLEERAKQANPPQVDRAKFAHDHAEALRPRLSRLRIILSPEAKALPLTVKIDGVPAQAELFDAGIPVDTGKRIVVASSSGYEDYPQTIAVDDEKMTLEMTVPPLKPKSASADKTPPSNNASLDDIDRLAAAKSQRTLGFVVGGIGAASLAVGGVFGFLAVKASNDSKCAGCINGSPELDNAESAYKRARTFAWVSDIALLAGVAGLGAGALLIITAKGSNDTKPSVTALSVGPNGVAIGGTL